MNRHLYYTAALLALGMASCSSRTGSQGVEPSPTHVVTDEEVDRYVQEQMRARRIPGLSLAVLRDGKILKLKGYGVASLESKEPATEDTVYRLASTTKLFTATAVMSLIEEGKIALEDRIGDHLPQLEPSWRRRTIHQLLSHTSGLPDTDIIANPMTGSTAAETHEEALKKAAEKPPVVVPGVRYDYIQTGYLLLGMIVEKTSKQSFPGFMEQRFFRPLGMGSTHFGDSVRVLPGHAVSYSRFRYDKELGAVPRETLIRYEDRFPEYAAPCATLNSSARDLAKWDAALTEGRLLKPSTMDQMWTAAEGGEYRLGDPRFGSGCGWYISGVPGHRTVGFGGWGANQYHRYLDDRLTVIILTNCAGAMPDSFIDGLAYPYVPALSEGAGR